MAYYTVPWRRLVSRGPLRRTAVGARARLDARAATRPQVAAPDLGVQVRQRLNRLYGWKGGERASPKDTAPAPEAVAVQSGGRVMMGQSDPRLLTMARPPFAVQALNNLSYGATATTIAEFNARGSTDRERLASYVDWQLNWDAIDDSAVTSRLTAAGYTTLNKSLTQLWADHVVTDPEYSIRIRPANEVQRAAFVRAVYSRRQLREVLVNFWHDHFNVLGNDFSTGPVFVHYDRDVIRANAKGNFRTMLEAVAQSTAMLYYLDNISNSRSGPNENFASTLR